MVRTDDFWIADLKGNGELQLKACYSYSLLMQIPNCAELIGQLSGALWATPEAFIQTLTPLPESLTIRWQATADSAGLMSIRNGETLVSISVLASGKNDEFDSSTLGALQSHLTSALHGTEHEPAFSLVELTERPLVATINLASPVGDLPKQMAAVADRCFAASYFRYLGVV